MNWQRAQREAESRVAALLESISAAGGCVAEIPLTNYPTPEDYDKILGVNAGWSWSDWLKVNRATVRLLRRAGYHVRLVPVTAAELFGWLVVNGLANTPANRAQFAAARGTAARPSSKN